MQEHLDTLTIRVGDMESSLQEAKRVQSEHMKQTAAHMVQTKRTEENTQELLETFNALKGAWKVLNFVGLLAKPVAAIMSFGAAWWWLRDHIKDIIRWL